MKSVIIAMAMLVGSSVFALGKPGSYGPGAYTKTVRMCGYANQEGNADNCRNMTYRYFAPRTVKLCGTEGTGSKVVCRNQTATGNWTYRVYAPGERRQEEQGNKTRQN